MEGISSQVATVDYLQLLTVQLQNQDPIDPADQEGLIRDLAQFSMLEGIEDLNSSFSEMLKYDQLSQGLDMVGKEVEYVDAGGETQTGTATEVFTGEGEIRLLVDDITVSLSSVNRVSLPQAA